MDSGKTRLTFHGTATDIAAAAADWGVTHEKSPIRFDAISGGGVPFRRESSAWIDGGVIRMEVTILNDCDNDGFWIGAASQMSHPELDVYALFSGHEGEFACTTWSGGEETGYRRIMKPVPDRFIDEDWEDSLVADVLMRVLSA